MSHGRSSVWTVLHTWKLLRAITGNLKELFIPMAAAIHSSVGRDFSFSPR